jgi:hypothetical protein
MSSPPPPTPYYYTLDQVRQMIGMTWRTKRFVFDVADLQSVPRRIDMTHHRDVARAFLLCYRETSTKREQVSKCLLMLLQVTQGHTAFDPKDVVDIRSIGHFES